MTRREIRLTEDQDAAIRQAAEAAGETVTAFMLRAARQTAARDNVLRREIAMRESFKGVVFKVVEMTP